MHDVACSYAHAEGAGAGGVALPPQEISSSKVKLLKGHTSEVFVGAFNPRLDILATGYVPSAPHQACALLASWLRRTCSSALVYGRVLQVGRRYGPLVATGRCERCRRHAVHRTAACGGCIQGTRHA
ncbi:hypothetical protein EON66_08190 [archaeon]|nr:MAG: hypothetical protein EON66_08190 [archaeon]